MDMKEFVQEVFPRPLSSTVDFELRTSLFVSLKYRLDFIRQFPQDQNLSHIEVYFSWPKPNTSPSS